ncbi:MAG: class I SAM-dependent methyltransferase [Anaerolineales bacterium]
MNIEYSFPRYLLSKQSVDDRALNKDVLSALKTHLTDAPVSIIEVGGGIGTMLARLLRWKVVSQVEYTLVDEMAENIAFARKWLPRWAEENGRKVENRGDRVRIYGKSCDVSVRLVQADVFDFIAQNPAPADLLIAHAFLDLLPMPKSLPKLLSLTNNLAWLTINFDGVTTFEPALDPELDAKIEQLYHQTMDSRPGGGDSQSGRHLFTYLEQAGARVEAAGASDWVVYPVEGRYPHDESYFLHFILYFFEESLGNHPDLEKDLFLPWLQKRRQQVMRGELIYIAHQMDFLVRVSR